MSATTTSAAKPESSPMEPMTTSASHYRNGRAPSHLEYTVQVGDDLMTWTPTTTQVGSTTENGDHTETITYRDTLSVANEDRRFIRLKVMLTP